MFGGPPHTTEANRRDRTGPLPRPRLSDLGTNRIESAPARAPNSPIEEDGCHRPIRGRQVRGPEGEGQSAAVAACGGKIQPMRRLE